MSKRGIGSDPSPPPGYQLWWTKIVRSSLFGKFSLSLSWSIELEPFERKENVESKLTRVYLGAQVCIALWNFVASTKGLPWIDRNQSKLVLVLLYFLNETKFFNGAFGLKEWKN